jgi:hypothetical protein
MTESHAQDTEPNIQDRIETLGVMAALTAGAIKGYMTADSLFEGHSTAGRVVEYSLKFGGTVLGSMLGALTAAGMIEVTKGIATGVEYGIQKLTDRPN